MRRIFCIGALGYLLLLAESGCSSSDNTVPADASIIVDTMKQGTWRITYFSDGTTDYTNYFTEYEFEFGESNSLTATSAGVTQNGFWSVTSYDGEDDNPSDDLDFNIIFTEPTDFARLSEDWDISERNSSKIRLCHISGDGSTDLLTMEKN